MITFEKQKSSKMKLVNKLNFLFCALLGMLFFHLQKAGAQDLAIEPVAGIQQIYPNSFLGEDRSYSQIALGALIHSHPGWLGFEANVFYAHNKFNEDQVHGVHIGGGPSFRLNDGVSKGKVSAFLSSGAFFNTGSYGLYASLRMRAQKFSYGVRYQIETGERLPKINVAFLSIGVPISVL